MALLPSLRLSLVAVSTVAIAACTDQPANSQDAATLPVQPASGQPAAEPVALGLTIPQLADADLIGMDGQELGEVERVVRDGEGAVIGLIVEIEDSNPDRFVQVPFDGLSSIRDGDDWDLQGDMTRDQLAALPDAIR